MKTANARGGAEGAAEGRMTGPRRVGRDPSRPSNSIRTRGSVAWWRPWLEQLQARTREFDVDRLGHVHPLVAAQAPS